MVLYKTTNMSRIFLPLIFCAVALLAADDHHFYDLGHSSDRKEAAWVDSVYNAMSERERWAQLIVIRANLDQDTIYDRQVENLIREHKVGGICYFNLNHSGTVEKQAALTNRYQAASPRIPLFVTIDGEWGLGMRMRETTISYPRQMMLGAIGNNRLIYDMGREIARQCRRVGININYAPVADVNNNAANPVINDRSFGENHYNVAAKCFQYMMGQQDGGVMASAKHFPGHGDTNTDSHHELPVIPYDFSRLDSLELFPFRVLVQNGIGSVMVAHLQVPIIDNRPNRPTSLSRNTITNLLRQDMDFEGLIFTDAMEMRAVGKYYQPGEADVEALRAGVDVVLLPADAGATLNAVEKALSAGTLDRAQLETSVRRVLRAKYRLGLHKPQRVELDNLRRDLLSPQALLLKRRLIAEALTLVRDRPGLVGFPNLEQTRFATLSLGTSKTTLFQKHCALYTGMDHFQNGGSITPEVAQRLLDSLSHYDVVLVGLHNMRSRAADNFGISDAQIQLVRRLSERTTVALAVFGNPYSLKYFDQIPILLEAYTEDPYAQELAAQALFGAIDLKGTLPVTVSTQAIYGQGIQKRWTQPRLGYDLPEAVGLQSDTLLLMDSIMQAVIRMGAAPGGQILVAKDNKIVWHKAYGHHTYEQKTPVALDDLFDVASVTKVAATTISTMRLVETGKICLDSTLQTYLPEVRNTNKAFLTLRELMAHHAGLQAWIPFYQQTLTPEKTPSPDIYKTQSAPGFDVPVAPNLYMNPAWRDSIWQQIFSSNLRNAKDYKYSDLGLYLTARTVQQIGKHPVNEFAEEYYYQRLGMSRTMFNPWQRGLAMHCAPTEEDKYFRQCRIQGYVHDMGAAMLGGVSGHAGLFSNANDLAKLFQMLLNGGSYFGTQYLKRSTVKEFTTRFARSQRRGLGFDLKELDPRESQNICDLAGPNTFGHYGFTGTCVFADPDQNLIFVFLSNRTYPTMDNNKLGAENIRPKCQGVVYRALQQKRQGD